MLRILRHWLYLFSNFVLVRDLCYVKLWWSNKIPSICCNILRLNLRLADWIMLDRKLLNHIRLGLNELSKVHRDALIVGTLELWNLSTLSLLTRNLRYLAELNRICFHGKVWNTSHGWRILTGRLCLKSWK